MINILHDDVSQTYLVGSDADADDVLKAAFGDQVSYDGISYLIRLCASRKADFIPAVTAVLDSYPGE